MDSVSDAIDTLKAKEASTSCTDLISLLEGLGFQVRRRSSGNHHTLGHPGIPGFIGANFDGGHGKVVKPCYVQAMRKLIKKYQTEITDYLKART